MRVTVDFGWVATVYDDADRQLTRFVSSDRRALLDFVTKYWLRKLDEQGRKSAARWLESFTPQRTSLVIYNIERKRRAEFLPAIEISRHTKIIYKNNTP